jgi:hypothetical protein
MKFTKFLVALIATCLLTTSAWAAGGATTYQFGQSEDQMLLRSQITSIATNAYCIALNQDVTADITGTACEDVDENEWTVTQNVQLTRIVVITMVVGDASDVCDFELEVAGTEVKTFNHSTDPTAKPVQTVTSYALPYNFADGDQVGLSVNTGTSCMTTATPVFQVEFWGRYVPSDAF